MKPVMTMPKLVRSFRFRCILPDSGGSSRSSSSTGTMTNTNWRSQVATTTTAAAASAEAELQGKAGRRGAATPRHKIYGAGLVEDDGVEEGRVSSPMAGNGIATIVEFCPDRSVEEPAPGRWFFGMRWVAAAASGGCLQSIENSMACACLELVVRIPCLEAPHVLSRNQRQKSHEGGVAPQGKSSIMNDPRQSLCHEAALHVGKEGAVHQPAEALQDEVSRGAKLIARRQDPCNVIAPL